MIKSMRDRISALDISPQKDAHAGLWLDRMLTAQLKKGESVASNEQHPTKILLNQACQQIKEPAGYQNFYRRWEAALKLQNNCLLKEAKASGRLVVGLGSESAWENSITLHRTYGVPYIPGSALKGLAAAYAHQYLEERVWNKAYTKKDEQGKEHKVPIGWAHQIMFGDTTSEGYVTFFDALYKPESGYKRQALWPDVITVHHPEYYRETQQEDKKDILPPADWDDPNPVSFVSATGEYLIALAGPDKWVEFAFDILALALADMGVGAKTSSGYGRLTLPNLETARQRLVTGKQEEVEDTPPDPELPDPELPDSFKLNVMAANASSLANKVNLLQDLPEELRKKGAELIIERAHVIFGKKVEGKPWFQELQKYLS